MRRTYDLQLVINGRRLSRVVIDPHYEAKHGDSVTDEVILALVRMLNGKEFIPEIVSTEGFEYFAEDGMCLEGKTYRLIWLLKETEVYVGVVNCYRRD